MLAAIRFFFTTQEYYQALNQVIQIEDQIPKPREAILIAPAPVLSNIPLNPLKHVQWLESEQRKIDEYREKIVLQAEEQKNINRTIKATVQSMFSPILEIMRLGNGLKAKMKLTRNPPTYTKTMPKNPLKQPKNRRGI